MPPFRPPFPVLAFPALALALLAIPAWAGEAVEGLDVVSLRDSGRLVPGAGFVTRWRGDEWSFANDANRATFEANPQAYAPGFAGDCPVALARGDHRPGRPDLFVVVDQKLYLTSSPEARARLSADPQGVISAAAQAGKRR